MLAFNEAIKRYEYERGSFLSFARLVINSRIKNYLKKENRYTHESIEENEIEDTSFSNEALKEEIKQFENELLKFGIDFEILIDEAPTHEKTRERAIKIGKLISGEQSIMDYIYTKKRLPITFVSRKFNYTVKIVRGSKLFILATSIIYYKKIELLINWIK